MTHSQYPRLEGDGPNLHLHLSEDVIVHVRPDGHHREHHYADGREQHVTEWRPLTPGLQEQLQQLRRGRQGRSPRVLG